MLREFRQFVFRGNLIDLAVAIVVGTAFGLLVTAFVEDLITPIIAAIFGQPDFGGMSFTINGSVFKYGDFLNALIAFLSVGRGDLLLRREADERHHRAHRAAGRRARDARVPRVPQPDPGRGAALLGLYLTGGAGQLAQTVVTADHGPTRPAWSTPWYLMV